MQCDNCGASLHRATDGDSVGESVGDPPLRNTAAGGRFSRQRRRERGATRRRGNVLLPRTHAGPHPLAAHGDQRALLVAVVPVLGPHVQTCTTPRAGVWVREPIDTGPLTLLHERARAVTVERPPWQLPAPPPSPQRPTVWEAEKRPTGGAAACWGLGALFSRGGCGRGLAALVVLEVGCAADRHTQSHGPLQIARCSERGKPHRLHARVVRHGDNTV